MGRPPTQGGISFDRAAGEYDAQRERLWQAEATAAALDPWLRPGVPVIEAGVGTGLIGGALRGRGRDVFGFDLSERMLHRALERLPGRVAAADAQRLPLAAGAAGSVYFVHVLHLVADVGATIAEAARVLRPGGRLLLVGSADEVEPADEAAAILGRVRRRLAGPPPDLPDRLIGEAESLGLSLVHREELAWAMRSAPDDYVQRLEQRVWSWTWDVPERTWAEVVEPALKALRALPNRDQAREGAHRRALLVFDAPGPVPGASVG
jgi:SAM-dependent methyltransferase